MNLSQSLPRSFTAAVLAAAVAMNFALAQNTSPAATEYQPQSGQEGKDVVWVPTPQALVDRMLDIARVTPEDYVIDLGSGDGRTVITAVKRGARSLGIEYNPEMVEYAKRNAAKEGVGDKAKFVQGDIFESNFSQATVITLFLLPELNVRLRPTLLDMRPGTRVVSNTFDMGDWEADETARASEECTSYCTAYFWIVPSKVEGKWQMPAGELELTQKYQMIIGTLKSGYVTAPVNGKLVGDRIAFNAGRSNYTGRVTGDAIEGVARSGGNETKWQATRAKK